MQRHKYALKWLYKKREYLLKMKLNGVMDVKEENECTVIFWASIFCWCLQKRVFEHCRLPFNCSQFNKCFNWAENAMVVKVPQRKGDQTGESFLFRNEWTHNMQIIY